eukprot:scaffold1296_cov74-Cyclotella_meneghiniana.AAC.5
MLRQQPKQVHPRDRHTPRTRTSMYRKLSGITMNTTNRSAQMMKTAKHETTKTLPLTWSVGLGMMCVDVISVISDGLLHSSAPRPVRGTICRYDDRWLFEEDRWPTVPYLCLGGLSTILRIMSG